MKEHTKNLKIKIMKRTIFALGVVLLTGTLMAGVNETAKGSSIMICLQEDANKVKITEDQLPQAIKTTLAKDDYKDWKVDAAYYYKGDKEYYQVVLKKNTDTKTVNFDKDGNVVM